MIHHPDRPQDDPELSEGRIVDGRLVVSPPQPPPHMTEAEATKLLGILMASFPGAKLERPTVLAWTQNYTSGGITYDNAVDAAKDLINTNAEGWIPNPAQIRDRARQLKRPDRKPLSDPSRQLPSAERTDPKYSTRRIEQDEAKEWFAEMKGKLAAARAKAREKGEWTAAPSRSTDSFSSSDRPIKTTTEALGGLLDDLREKNE